MLRARRIPFVLALGAAVVMLGWAVAEGQLGKLKDKAKLTSEKTLKVGDIEPKLKDMPLVGDIKFKGIKYDEIDEPEYDGFFLSSAKIHGLVELNQELAESATKSLKKFAMSKMADEAMKENIKGLVGDTPPDKWTTEQSIAVMQMAKQQDKISADEKRYFVQSAGTLAVGMAALTKGLESVKELMEQGKGLKESTGDLEKIKIPAAAKGSKTSLGHLQDAKEKGPVLAEELKVLTTAFKALSADDEEEKEE